jgi:acyl dehydratase
MALKQANSKSATVHRTAVEDLKRTQIVQYAGASGDYNPLHTDETHDQSGGLPVVLAC